MPTLVRPAVSSILGLVGFALLLFVPAGTLDYWQAWAFIGVFAVISLVPSLYLSRIDPAAIERFQRETGIIVHYDVDDSLETLEGKLLAGHSGYDVVVPTSEPTFSRLVRSGALATLDRARIPNAAGLDPLLMSRVASSDPGNAHGVIYLWGTVGLGVNMGKIRALAPDAPLDSWDLLFKPENARRLAPCGITILDSAIDVIPSALALARGMARA